MTFAPVDDLDRSEMKFLTSCHRLLHPELPPTTLLAEMIEVLEGRWATALDVLERGADAIVGETVAETEALYVSIDLDVLDSSVAAGHSLQEPGGLSYRELRAILVEVARRGRVIGFDDVELNPARDPSGATARVATWIVTPFLSEIFEQPR